MASIIVSGDTSGSVTLAAPAVAGTTTLTLPTTTGTLVVTSGAQTIEFADGTVSAPSITNSGDTNTGIFFPAADTIAFTEGGAESMRIDSSGNVGIGTTSFIQALSIFRGAGVGAGIEMAGNGATLGTSSVFVGQGNDGTCFLYQRAANNMTFGTSNTERMRIDSSGNVGIGTSTPDIYSTSFARQFTASTATASGYSVGTFAGGSGGGGGVEFGNQTVRQAGIYSLDGSALALYTNATNSGITLTNRMLIGSDGFTNLFVTNNDGFTSRSSAAAGTSVATFVGRHSATNTLNGSLSFVVWSNGNVVNTNNSYGAISDIKLKENIIPASPKLDKLMQVEIVNYNLKDTPEHKLIGVVAQQLEKVFPSLIEESPDRDVDGNLLEATTKSVKYSVFVPMLIKAIQELKAIVDTQTTKIAELEAKLEGTE